MASVPTKNVVQRTLEPVQNLVQARQCGTLLPVFQPVERRFRQSQLAGEGVKRRVPPPPPEELGQFLVEATLHRPRILPNFLFRMRNNWRCKTNDLALTHHNIHHYEPQKRGIGQ